MDSKWIALLLLLGVGFSLVAAAYFGRRFVRNMNNVGGELARMSAGSLYFMGGIMILAGGHGLLKELGLL